jgi:hypothetical protein
VENNPVDLAAQKRFAQIVFGQDVLVVNAKARVVAFNAQVATKTFVASNSTKVTSKNRALR